MSTITLCHTLYYFTFLFIFCYLLFFDFNFIFICSFLVSVWRFACVAQLSRTYTPRIQSLSAFENTHTILSLQRSFETRFRVAKLKQRCAYRIRYYVDGRLSHVSLHYIIFYVFRIHAFYRSTNFIPQCGNAN